MTTTHLIISLVVLVLWTFLGLVAYCKHRKRKKEGRLWPNRQPMPEWYTRFLEQERDFDDACDKADGFGED